jgi:tRNA threonylcarbamoyladenosine biosynthesis protein TsaE
VSAAPLPGDGSPVVFDAGTEADTQNFAGRFASILRAGDVVALDGPLGAGKTRFVQGIAAALGCDRSFVNSPTFGLVQVYEGRLPVVHIDAYRLRDEDEFEELGGTELLDPAGVTLIEWADRISAALPRERWQVLAEHVSETSRRYTATSSHRDRDVREQTLRNATRDL